jgi:hypothetical protein
MFQRYDSVKTDDLLQGAQQHDNWKPDTLMTPTIKEAEIGKGAMSQALDRTKREVLVIRHAPVAQLDRASGFEPAGRRFNSCRAHQIKQPLRNVRSSLNLENLTVVRFFVRVLLLSALVENVVYPRGFTASENPFTSLVKK